MLEYRHPKLPGQVLVLSVDLVVTCMGRSCGFGHVMLKGSSLLIWGWMDERIPVGKLKASYNRQLASAVHLPSFVMVV